MKKIIVIPFFIFLLAVAGCGTIYSTAMDERNMSTIASDTTIKGAIVKKFYDDDKIKSLDISTGCYDGHVYLVGEYDTADQKNRAIKIAKGVDGVKNVTTYLLPKKKGDPCGTDENLEIVGKVKAKLVGDKGIWSTNIDIKSIQCQVVLYGLVGSKEEINKAILHAKSVEGIRGVKSFLKSAN
jgi:hyperosmotically inducible periplasmic protein